MTEIEAEARKWAEAKLDDADMQIIRGWFDAPEEDRPQGDGLRLPLPRQGDAHAAAHA